MSCNNLTKIIVDDNNKYYSSVDGILYNKAKTRLICCPAGKKTANNIPSGVTNIGDYAFYFCTNLTSVTLPSGLTSIEDNAFVGCDSLTSIVIPSNVKSIGRGAFGPCTNLKSITIPDSVTNIEGAVLSDTAWYESKPDGLVYAGKIAYAYKGEMPSGTKIVIKDGTKGIADYAFWTCEGLTSITIPSSVTNIGEEAFFSCRGLKNISIPDSVTSIGSRAFSDCEGLADSNGFVIVKGVLYNYYGDAARVAIPSGVTSIGDGAFSDCSTLTSITIPSNVTGIGSSAFAYCSGLTNLTIPNSVTSIGQSAFCGCSSLMKINIPQSVIKTGGWIFSGCENLADSNGFVISNNVIYDYIGDNSEVTIPNGVTAVSDFAFYGAVSSVTIPSSVTRIGEEAFFSWSMESVTIPASVTTIGDYAFGYYGKGEKIRKTDFVVYGKTGSAAETYAKNNGFKFVAQSEVQPTGITLNKTSLTIEKGKSAKLTATVSPSNATDRTVTWTTSNSKVATVSEYGTVKAVAAGTATITAKTKNGKTATCKVTVTAAAELKNNSTISATSVTANTEVTMTGKATGGTSPYKYAYYYKKSTDSVWTKAYVTSSGSVYTKYDSMKFTPKTAGTYNVRINVKDKYGEGNVVSKDFTVKVK